MNPNTIALLLRIAGLVVASLLGGALYPVTVNILIYFQMMPPEQMGQAFGIVLTNKTVYVWLGANLLGIIALFIPQSWGKILYFSPLYAPSLFAVVYTLMNH